MQTIGTPRLDVARTVEQVQTCDQALILVEQCLKFVLAARADINQVRYTQLDARHPQFKAATSALQELQKWMRTERDWYLGQLLNEGQLGLPLPDNET